MSAAPNANTHGLRISPATDSAALTPEQKRFNTLIGQIEAARRTLAAWHDAIPAYRSAHAKAVQPLAKTLRAAEREWTFALGRLLDQAGWTKTERETLRDLVCDSAAELLGAGHDDDPNDPDDAALKALFEQHREAEAPSDASGIESAATDTNAARDAEDAAAEPADDQPGDADDQPYDADQAQAARQQRKAAAAQRRREAEAQLATQSVRDIYRKLASALHPDREPDATLRATKTALMQQANRAYEANDLLTLLELQGRIEQVDAGRLAAAPAQRLKQYNLLLAEQLRELRQETERTAMGFGLDAGLRTAWNIQPDKLPGLIDQTARQLRAMLLAREQQTRLLNNKVATKQWLKQARRQRREAGFYGNADDGFF